MSDKNLALYVAGYSEAGVADEDYTSLKSLADLDLYIVAAVIVDRDADGKLKVRDKEHIVSGGTAIGGGLGLLIGLFAPPLLAATAIGAGLGAAIGGLTKHHREHEMEKELEDLVPNDSSAIIVLLDDVYADQVAAALAKAEKKALKKVDAASAKDLAAALSEAEATDTEVVAQVNSQA